MAEDKNTGTPDYQLLRNGSRTNMKSPEMTHLWASAAESDYSVFSEGILRTPEKAQSSTQSTGHPVFKPAPEHATLETGISVPLGGRFLCVFICQVYNLNSSHPF